MRSLPLAARAAGGAGVLAWCWDEGEARVARRAIAALGEYRNLTIERLR